MWREIRRILAHVAVTFRSTLQANRSRIRFLAHIAGVSLLLCVASLRRLTAQDSARLSLRDSTGYISRAESQRFHQSLPVLPPLTTVRPDWSTLPRGYFRTHAAAEFDSVVTDRSARFIGDLMLRHQASRFALRQLATDTETVSRDRGLFGLSRNTADVTFDGLLDFALTTTRQRNLACSPAELQNVASGCFGGFSAPKIDNTVQLHSTGVFAQRFHINIDFESQRDYGVGNVISASYVGLEDEKLQRVDLGTVLFRPPPSRYFTASIPTNNFGVSAQMQFGPVRVQAIAAAQKGSQLVTKTIVVGNGTVEPQDLLRRDVDYVTGRLFWVVNPRTLPGFPRVDILNAGSIPVPAGQVPSEIHIYRYVAANPTAGANSNYDGITATASNGIETVGRVRWRLLKRNEDYWIDPSGLWFVLSQSISPNDYLAVSYRTTDGTTVGTLPTSDNPAANDALQLVYLPNRGPNSPLFFYSMRQVYRVAGSSLVRGSLRAAVQQNLSEKPAQGSGTFLSLLGLAIPADQATLDVDNRVFPRLRDAGASAVIKDAYIIFPEAQPFSDVQLTSDERNDSLYVTPEYLLLSQGPPSKFQLHLLFDAQSGSDRSSVSLGGAQIADQSEHLEVNNVVLKQGLDYTIDYATGRVVFLDPNGLFGSGSATLNVSYEERNAFAQAPTSLAGAAATWTLGTNKTISFAGLYQAEQTGYTRPQIGYEARASFLAGITGDFTFNTPTLTRLLNKVERKKSTAPSSFYLNGEIAMSRPDLNRSGDAYLEEFEDDHAIPVSASQNLWQYGSVPKSNAGVEDILPQGFDSADAVQLIMQNLIPNQHDSLTQLSPHDIDTTIVLTSSKTPTIEPVLWLTLHADTAGGVLRYTPSSYWSLPARPFQPRWRTMTSSISQTGADLSRNDYFQFSVYQALNQPLDSTRTRMVIDLGRVSEDALAIAPTTFEVRSPTDTFYTGRQYVGTGRLDTEKTLFGSWSAQTDDTGILGDRPDSLIGTGASAGLVLHRPPLCTDSLTATVHIVPWGDLGARCSRGNGAVNSEDLDGDNVLDAQGSSDDVYRYIIDFHADSARYFLRRHSLVDSTTGRVLATWTTYRIPLRDARDTIGSPDIHLIKQMRVAFVTPAELGDSDEVVRLGLALMKFTGAPWVARAAQPIASLSGTIAGFHGGVQVGTISTQETDSLHLAETYTSPPGIGNESDKVNVSQTDLSQQINEKSLRIVANDLRPGERAEGYNRLTSGTTNLLVYRQVRVWVRGHGAGWNGGPLQAYVKIGSDANNFYLYRAPAMTTTWDPELVIDVQTWQDLREQIENARLHGQPPSGADRCGGDPEAYVACDGNYLVQVRDPQINPPNLAAVQELAAGIYYPPGSGGPIAQTELWVDDIRVSEPLSKTGIAGALATRVIGSDLFILDAVGTYQNGQFRQMGQSPTYQDLTTFQTSGVLHLEKFFSPRLWLLMPVTYSTAWGWVAPQLIGGTDIETAGLDDLRRPRNNAATWTVALREQAHPNQSRLTQVLLTPLAFNATGTSASNTTSLSDASSSSWSGTLGYNFTRSRRAFSLGLRGLTSGLPRWLQRSSIGQGLSKASFAPLPTAVQLSSTLSHTMGDLQSYQLPIQTLADTILKPVTNEQYLWRNTAGINWEPLGILRITSSLASTRDLREYSDSTSLGRVVNDSHRSLFGADVGVERDRNLSNNISLAPRLASWILPQVTVGTNFTLSRSLTTRNPVRVDGDTAGNYILPQTINNSRVTEFRISIDPHALSQRILGDSSHFSRGIIRVQPIQIIRRYTLESVYDLATFNPGLSYQLALGNRNTFLTHHGEEAIGVDDAVTTNVIGTLDLPSGFSAQASYASTSSDRFQRRSGPGFLENTGTVTTWPSGRISWGRSFRRGPVNSATLSSGIQRDLSSSFSPFEDGTSTSAVSTTRRVTPDVLLVFRNAMSFHASGDVDNSTATANGNVTETASSNLTQSFAWSMRLPRFVSVTRRQLSTDVTVSENTSSSCIQRVSDSACQSYYDVRRFEVHGGFTALLQHNIRTGLRLGYIHNDVKSLLQLSSTITISATLSIPLSSLGM
jgi:hypothetical protein